MPLSSFEEHEKQEFLVASNDLAKATPQEALLRFYRRHDAAVTNTIKVSARKPACQSGCSYCCYYKVVARAAEVVAIHQYVLSRFTQNQIKAVVEQATHNVSEASGLSHAQHLAINQRCPFLFDGKCGIYPVRPSKCRSFHASDVEGCKASFERPTDLSIPNSYIPEVFNASSGMSEGFNYASAKAGVDARIYDLNSAFLEAMKSPSASKRLKNGKRVFLDAKTETPLGE